MVDDKTKELLEGIPYLEGTYDANAVLVYRIKRPTIKGDRINSGLKARITFFPFFAFNPAKEVLHSFSKSVRNILFDLRMNFIKSSTHQFVTIKLIQSFSQFIIIKFVEFKKFIINLLTNYKRINQSLLLLPRRIQAIFEHLNNHIHSKSLLIFKPYAYLSSDQWAFHPITKVMGIQSRGGS